MLTVKRLQIMLDEDLDRELARRARVEKRSKASIIRDSLRQTLEPLPPLEDDPLWGMVGAAGDAEPVENIDEYLIDLKLAKMRKAK
jgi:hypothetical protein